MISLYYAVYQYHRNGTIPDEKLVDYLLAETEAYLKDLKDFYPMNHLSTYKKRQIITEFRISISLLIQEKLNDNPNHS